VGAQRPKPDSQTPRARLLHRVHVLNIRFELRRPRLRLCKPLVKMPQLLVKMPQLLAKLLDLMIAGADLLLVEAVGVIPLKKLPMGFVEMAAEFVFAHTDTDRQNALFSTRASSCPGSGCP
jgi:hypothetical protein